MSFLKNNLHHTQQGQNFNSTGILEISEIALEELCQNALTHRDYSKNASVNLLISTPFSSKTAGMTKEDKTSMTINAMAAKVKLAMDPAT